jgi:hypothetical protein
MSRIVPALVLTTTSPLLLPNAAAQFGLYTLPQNDFTWHWGQSSPEQAARGIADIEARGSEGFFQCELTAKTRTLTLTTEETREIETQLTGRLDFIYAVNEAMYYLDQSRQLDWATLDCKKYKEEPKTAEESAEREAEAREKMLRELERRRARQNAE